MDTKITQKDIEEILKVKPDGYLYHRESNQLEFKESFNLSSLSEYFKDFAGFANNYGGYLVFGVSNSPRKLLGLPDSSFKQFEKVDPEKITGFLLELFNPNIRWEQQSYEFNSKRFGFFYIYPSKVKPIIAKKDSDPIIRNGDIFFRYGGRTQRIQFPELNSIIQENIQNLNNSWVNQVQNIARIGPESVALLDTEKGIIEKNSKGLYMIDEKLLPNLNFIQENTSESILEGKPLLKIVGQVLPVNSVETIRYKSKNILDEYPLSFHQLRDLIKEILPNINQHLIHQIIRENLIKENKTYSIYNFRNKRQKERYEKEGVIHPSTPSIYNNYALEFIVNIVKNNAE